MAERRAFIAGALSSACLGAALSLVLFLRNKHGHPRRRRRGDSECLSEAPKQQSVEITPQSTPQSTPQRPPLSPGLSRARVQSASPRRVIRQASMGSKLLAGIPRLSLRAGDEAGGDFPVLRRITHNLDDTVAGAGVKPVVMAVAGGSGSGKTTLATAIFEALGGEHITFISHDNYYRDLSHLPASERRKQNFDHPDALETDLMYEHISALLRGEDVDIPTYDFNSHSRRRGPEATVKATVRPIILVEGILIFTDAKLVELFDIKIFVDTDADTRFIRRLQRDVKDRGRGVQDVVEQYLGSVRPMHQKFCEPSKRCADIIVPVGLNSVALDLLISRLTFAINH